MLQGAQRPEALRLEKVVCRRPVDGIAAALAQLALDEALVVRAHAVDVLLEAGKLLVDLSHLLVVRVKPLVLRVELLVVRVELLVVRVELLVVLVNKLVCSLTTRLVATRWLWMFPTALFMRWTLDSSGNLFMAAAATAALACLVPWRVPGLTPGPSAGSLLPLAGARPAWARTLESI